MFRTQFRIAWRNLHRDRASTIINIGGLAVGMSVAMLIGFWIMNEWSYDRSFKNYNRIAQVLECQTINGVFGTQKQVPIPVATTLQAQFGSDFKHVVLSTMTQDHILILGDKKLSKTGNFIQAEAPEMLTLRMVEGSRNGLSDPKSIFLSNSTAKALFAEADPLDKTIRLDDSLAVKVTGVYEDFPANSSFKDITFLAPWDLYASIDAETHQNQQQWEDNGWQVFVQVNDKANFEKVSAKIRNIKADNDAYVKATDLMKPIMFLHPMSRWHLFSEFKNGVNTGGRIQYVQLFGLIGVFVLLLGCINFMNLSTAKSERRAKEVGIRKTIGSLRSQLIAQFFGESLLVAFLAFLVSLALVQFSLPVFNTLAQENISIPWTRPGFWLAGAGFCLVTGLIAGSYPALYLSSFQPVRVLKGVFRSGQRASLFRKTLVVTQFTISICLIIGTIIVFRQIEFARNRPVGYTREGLLVVSMHTQDIHQHFAAFRTDLLRAQAVSEVAESTSPTTVFGDVNGGLNWTGKPPGATDDNFAMKGVSPEYARTIGLQFTLGRDFRSGPQGSDAMTMILSESTVKHMGFADPIGKNVTWEGYKFTVVGVVKDIVMETPYEDPVPTIYYMAPYPIFTLNISISPNISAKEAVSRISPIFSKYSPAEPFDYKFVDNEYAAKFQAEERIGSLASFFAILAVFISCLGLFGLASYVAEQRTKEIGIRKVLGASLLDLWQMLSKEFVALVVLSCLIAVPIAWFILHRWLQQYAYHTAISWWIFVLSACGAILITLGTVSQQAIRAALSNPVKSLKME